MDPEELKRLISEALSESLMHGGNVLDRQELHDLMHNAVVEAMSTLGIDARNPLDVQKDMLFIRELRLISESVKKKTYLTMVALVIGALAAAMWLGFKSLLGQ